MTLPHDYSKLVEYYEVLEEGGADRNSFLEKILNVKTLGGDLSTCS